MLFFAEVAWRYLPNPKPLRDAIISGHVDITQLAGSTVYLISRQCHNVDEVEAAIMRRNAWVRVVADIESVVLATAFVFILYFAWHF
ncbi:hypothetical protein GTP46_06070 [Duganella sp. FT135W]|uniref:Uncharacterized protein n=1 Tax=Duganella flavida TaxID=2692175 RepID=A0A6L8K5I3_9BURK|nr:hypothetical protein [Duganella flavida]MYM22205.1 hypothetical protein [Duganella flavida]